MNKELDKALMAVETLLAGRGVEDCFDARRMALVRSLMAESWLSGKTAGFREMPILAPHSWQTEEHSERSAFSPIDVEQG